MLLNEFKLIKAINKESVIFVTIGIFAKGVMMY